MNRPRQRISTAALLRAALALLLAPPAVLLAGEPAAAAPGYLPGKVVVQFAQPAGARAAIRLRVATGTEANEPSTIDLRTGESVQAALRNLRARHDVEWAVPDYIAHSAVAPAANPAPIFPNPHRATRSSLAAAEEALAQALTPAPFIPINEGASHNRGGWEALQWNFAGQYGVGAPQAWGNLIADRAPGGRGVVVAVLDTGVAFRGWRRFRRSPGFSRNQFVAGRDFVNMKTPPVDRNGHGTFVAGEIAQRTNVPYGLTGLAYGVKLMPIRVLNRAGEGDAATIARGIRFAVRHHAQIINLSLEFPVSITSSDVPELVSALRMARAHKVMIVAAAGNDSTSTIPFPARAGGVVAVGASTEHGCLADYSNFGPHIALVAPGGGPDATRLHDPNCHPYATPGRNIFQTTYQHAVPGRFGLPASYEGTSMAAPEVAATAALLIASGVLGTRPTPEAILKRLTATAVPLGGEHDRSAYGAGLLDAAAATAAGGPGAVGAPG